LPDDEAVAGQEEEIVLKTKLHEGALAGSEFFAAMQKRFRLWFRWFRNENAHEFAASFSERMEGALAARQFFG